MEIICRLKSATRPVFNFPDFPAYSPLMSIKDLMKMDVVANQRHKNDTSWTGTCYGLIFRNVAKPQQ